MKKSFIALALNEDLHAYTFNAVFSTKQEKGSRAIELLTEIFITVISNKNITYISHAIPLDKDILYYSYEATHQTYYMQM